MHKATAKEQPTSLLRSILPLQKEVSGFRAVTLKHTDTSFPSKKAESTQALDCWSKIISLLRSILPLQPAAIGHKPAVETASCEHTAIVDQAIGVRMQKVFYTGKLGDMEKLFALMRIERDPAMQSTVKDWLRCRTSRKPSRELWPCVLILQWDRAGIDSKSSSIHFLNFQ
jgi:hypothetical protein